MAVAQNEDEEHMSKKEIDYCDDIYTINEEKVKVKLRLERNCL